MQELDTTAWIVLAVCAMLVGIAKTGIPGVNVLVVPLLAAVFGAHRSVGMLLGILILADLFAAAYYRRHAHWGHIIRLLPVTFAGIAAGYFFLKVVNDEQLKAVIGIIVLVMLIVNYWRGRASGGDAPVPKQRWFAVGVGFFAGVSTMMANAAGPIMAIYLLAMKLPKVAFVGTGAWFFFIVNWLKVPFSTNLDMMTAETVKINLMLLPFIAIGAIIGILALKRIPQKAFTIIVQILAAAAAVKLLL